MSRCLINSVSIPEDESDSFLSKEVMTSENSVIAVTQQQVCEDQTIQIHESFQTDGTYDTVTNAIENLETDTGNPNGQTETVNIYQSELTEKITVTSQEVSISDGKRKENENAVDLENECNFVYEPYQTRINEKKSHCSHSDI